MQLTDVICDEAGEPVDYRFLDANRAYERFMGIPRADLVGRRVSEAVPLADRAAVLRICRVAMTGIPDQFAGYSVAADRHWEVTCFSPLPGQCLTQIVDVSERVRAEAEIERRNEQVAAANERLAEQAIRLGALAEASMVLSGVGHDRTGGLEIAVRLISEAFGDLCRIRTLSEDAAHLELVAVHSPDVDLTEVVRSVEAPSLDLASERSPAADVIRTGMSRLVETIPPDVNRATSMPAFVPFLDRFSPHSFLMVPLRADDRVIGVLSLTRYRPGAPSYTGEDRRFAQELADRAAMAIANTRLLAQVQDELRERRKAERAVRALNRTLERRVADRTAALDAANRELEAYSSSVSHERQGLAAAVEQASDGIVIFDGNGLLSYANQAFLDRSGQPADDLAGADASELIRNATGQDAFPRFLEAALAGKPWNEAFDQVAPDGSISHIEIRMSPIRGDGGTVTSYVAFVSDVTHLRETEAELALEGRVRAALAEALHAIPAEATVAEAAQTICDQLVTLPFIRLAAVEAFLGAGQVEIIARSAPDGFPFHVGARLPSARAAIVQERSVHGPWAQYVTGDAADGWTDQDLAVGLKALAYGPIAHGEHISGVLVIGTLDAAFARVLVEKLPGIVSFSTASSALLADRMRLMRQSSDLRAGIEQVLAAHAFRPVFQPIVDLASGEVMGYEALTRFDSGQRPDRCFADAWSVGLGQELEVATLGAAVRESSALPANAWLALNVSPRMLRDPERLRDVVSVAERPLVIEVTEHEAIPDYDAIRESVRAIGRDVRLAVDDAGAGVANFNHIIDLRPDFVKLDMSLVRRVHVDLGRQAMVVGMRHFSRTAGCRLLAEGVETAEEARALRALGVEFAQGYHFGRPALVDALRDATSEAAT